jgi:N-glycosylase/DNA lyase
MVDEEADKIVLTAAGGADARWIWHFFDLDTDYAKIADEISHTLPSTAARVLGPVIAAGRGIRILRQDFVRTVISFIISANNNIKRFSKTIAQIDFANLAQYTAEDFRKMGCGYRAPYLVETIKMLAGGGQEFWGILNTGDARKTLLTLPGVGPKVADCILLFALHRLDVAPVDTWIQKAIEKLGPGVLTGPYAGVLQQYIFYYTQYLKKKFLTREYQPMIRVARGFYKCPKPL